MNTEELLLQRIKYLEDQIDIISRRYYVELGRRIEAENGAHSAIDFAKWHPAGGGGDML